MEVSNGAVTAGQSREEFLQLLVAQLRNQDPLQPVKQEDFLAQLAQFSTLEGIENLNSTFDEQLQLQHDAAWMNQLSQASSLIGREASYRNEDAELVTGVVDSVQIRSDGFSVQIGNDQVEFDRLTEISEAPAASDATDGAEQTTSDSSNDVNSNTTDNIDDQPTTPASQPATTNSIPLASQPVNALRRLAALR